MEIKKMVLSNNLLFDDTINYKNVFLDYDYRQNSIGIVDRVVNNQRKYFVYKIGERSIDWEIEVDDYDIAILIAREKYTHLIAYLNEIDRINNDHIISKKFKK